MNQTHGFLGEDVAGDDKEEGDSIMAAAEEVSDEQKGGKMIFTVEAKAHLENVAVLRMRPKLVVMPVDQKGGGAFKAVQIYRGPQVFCRTPTAKKVPGNRVTLTKIGTWTASQHRATLQTPKSRPRRWVSQPNFEEILA
jgi:hypothetical protein